MGAGKANWLLLFSLEQTIPHSGKRIFHGCDAARTHILLRFLQHAKKLPLRVCALVGCLNSIHRQRLLLYDYIMG